MRAYLVWIVWIWAAGVGGAQNGSIRGKVIEEATGENIVAATIQIPSLSLSTISDLDGNFIFVKVPAGVYSVECSYLGYGTQRVDGASVGEDGVKLVYFKLKEGDAQELGVEVVVTAELEESRYKEGALLAQRKKSAKFIETMSAEEIERLGVYTIAQAARLIPNVSIEKERNVYIRGLGSRYVKTLLNGSEIPGLDLNSSSVQLDVFPTGVIDNIIVYKTFSPELIGSYGGGFVDISTKSFPDKFIFQANVGGGINTAATFNRDFKTYYGGDLDWMGIDDGARELPLEVVIDEIHPPKLPPNGAYGYAINSKGAMDTLNYISQSFELDDYIAWVSDTKIAPPNTNLSLVVGNQSPVKNGVLSYGAVALYKSSHSYFKNGFTGIYDLAHPVDKTFSLRPKLELQEENSTFNVRSNLFIHLGYKSKRHKISLNVLQNRDTDKSFVTQHGYYYFWDNDTITWQPEYLSQSWVFNEQGILSGQLQGKHLSKREGNFFEWQLAGAYSYIRQPDLRYASLAYGFVDSLGQPSYIMSDFIGQSPTRYWRNISAVSLEGRFDWTVVGGQRRRAKYRFGLRTNNQVRSFYEQQYRYFDTDFVYTGAFERFFVDQPLQWDTTTNSVRPGGLFIYEADEPNNNYVANEFVIASYMGLEHTIGRDDRWKLAGGFRLEMPIILLAYGDFFLGFIESFRLDTIQVLPQFLPSISLHHEVKKDMFLRWSYTRTYARPSLREYAKFTSFDFIGDYKIQGNEALRPTVLNNLDFRWEWFLGKKELLSAGIFGKWMQKPIETVSTDWAPNTVFEFRNAPWAGLAGIEVEFRKQLDFLGAWAKDLTWTGNFAYIYSAARIPTAELAVIRDFDPTAAAHRPLFGQSPYVFNTSVTYQSAAHGWSANVSFNMVGRRLAYIMHGATPNIYEQARPVMSLNVAKDLGKFFQIRLFVENVLAQPIRYIQTFKGKTYPYRIQPTAPTFWLSVQYAID